MIVAREDVRKITFGPDVSAAGNNSMRFSVSSKMDWFGGLVDFFSHIESRMSMQWRAAGGVESRESIRARTQSFLNWLMQREDSVVVVVCHGFLISSLFGHATSTTEDIRREA